MAMRSLPGIHQLLIVAVDRKASRIVVVEQPAVVDYTVDTTVVVVDCIVAILGMFRLFLVGMGLERFVVLLLVVLLPFVVAVGSIDLSLMMMLLLVVVMLLILLL